MQMLFQVFSPPQSMRLCERVFQDVQFVVGQALRGYKGIHPHKHLF